MGVSAVELRVEQRHIDAARAAGACKNGLLGVTAGADVSSLTVKQLEWFSRFVPRLAREAEKEAGVPLWCMSCHGDGSGDGSGDGDGSGGGSYGYGYGYGSGYGYGFGDGSYGYGSDYGHGYGDGVGDGDSQWGML